MMKVLPRVRFGLAASALVVVASVTAMRTAYAGALQVRDGAHVLSSDDTTRLRSVLAAAPFDGRFVVTSEYPDAQELSRYVRSLVNEPDMVVVGLDPEHRHVQVHFGTGDRIAPSERAGIERAGNDAFKRSDWEGGAAAIFQAASRATATDGASRGVQPTPAPVVAQRPSLFGPAVLLLLLVGGLGLALFLARRRSGYGPIAGQGGYGYGQQPPYGGSGYGGPGYPMPPPQGGMGPMGGGLIGAGLGGLAGYELGKYEGERERESHAEREDRGGNFDAGGGGSSWDDAGGGGFDGGGGGGGFDGGGGGDSGGGGDF